MLDELKAHLLWLGWVDKGDVLVRYSHPRLGWKPSDGTLIIGFREYPEKVTDRRQMAAIIQDLYL